MTLSTSTSREPTYTATGSDSLYAFSFPVYDETQLQVTVATNATPPVVTTLVLTTDYTVALSSTSLPSAGSITLTAGNLTAGYLLSIRRVTPLTQQTDLVNQGSFSASTHERKFDDLVMKAQQLQDQASRSIHLPEQEAGTAALTTLPDLASRKGMYLYFDPTTGGVSVASQLSLGGATTTPYTLTLLDDADAATARNTLGAVAGLWTNATITPKTITAALLASDAVAQIFQARLTLTTGVPVTVSDVLAATSIFVTPYGGDKISLYDGTDWRVHTLTQVTAAVPNTTVTMYDVFIYDNAGTLTLDVVAWTNDTTRATALATQNGVLVKTGATGRRYVGSFRTTGVSGTTEDSYAKRFCWNFYNRKRRPMRVLEATGTWTYTTATWRQANGAAANQLDFIIGVSEECVTAVVKVAASNSSGSVERGAAIGLDSTTAPAAACLRHRIDGMGAGEISEHVSTYEDFIAVGRHTLVWLEVSLAAGTTTWIGDNNTGDSWQSGITGSLQG